MNVGALLRVTGLVQGVGFRPFVHRLATRLQLSGWVRNTAADVEIAVEGDATGIEAFCAALAREAPPMARIEAVERNGRAPAAGAAGFAIAASAGGTGRQSVSPDLATCDECARELFDSSDRRHGYAFITCTDCGPRFSVIDVMPYDRQRTSMRAFPMCEACATEYHSAGHRRHHSQSNSCPACGPRLWLASPGGSVLAERRAAVEAAAGRLRRGAIVAVRGLGGFQLAVDATDEAAVRRLRARKHRDAKPLAVMVRRLAEVRRLVTLSPAEAGVLDSPQRPVVVARARPGSPLAPSVAPGLGFVGVMLATTGLHHLLLEAVGGPLVMTSGNLADEPIAIANGEALESLAGVADVFLLHDREIVARYDDSVLRCGAGLTMLIRRARGYAPLPLPLPVGTPRPIVAVGPHLKNTVTLADGGRAWVSQHVGDLDDLAGLRHFHDVIARLRHLFHVDPDVAARDLHPGYLSTRLASELGLARVIAVQHHHAHVAAVAAEHGVTEPLLGLACDGAGYGDDGTVWGSELLVADLTGYRRVGHLVPAPLPGGDLAARCPWRAALGYLHLRPGAAGSFVRALDVAPDAELLAARAQLARGVNAPLASSLGRLFDAAAAVLGVRHVSQYEGQAAMELESLAGRRAARELCPLIVERDGRWQLDPLPWLIILGERRRHGEDAATLAGVFHESVAAGLAELARRASEAHGIRTIALGGGSFQNVRLLASLRRRLMEGGMRVLVPQLLPPNDGAISYGQAAVAAAILAREGAA